jgi:hypothetical protein
MSIKLFEKIKDWIAPPAKVGQPLWNEKPDTIERELAYFKDAFRIGILCFDNGQEEHDLVMKYKKELDHLGYETEVLMYVDNKEMPKYCYLPYIKWTDLNKQGLPYNPRTDRFVKKKFDLLMNLFFADAVPLKHLAHLSVAKCRVGAYRPFLKEVSDVFVYTDKDNDLKKLIESINEILKKQAYARKIY